MAWRRANAHGIIIPSAGLTGFSSGHCRLLGCPAQGDRATLSDKRPAADGRCASVDGKAVIGWSVDVGFPDWDIPPVRAKVDTGARTSALHVEDLVRLPHGRVSFDVIVGRKPPYKRVSVCAHVVKWGRVRSSTGHYTTRCFVRTRVRIGPIGKEIEVSLVSRERMLYRMLLGRKALEKDFLIDVSRRRTPKLKKKRKAKKKRAAST